MNKATEGMSDSGKYLTNIASTAAQNAYLMPLAAVNPSLAAGAMAVSAVGQSTKQRADEGTPLQQANVRSAIDGYIDYLIGKIGMDATAELLLGKGGTIKNIAKNIT